MSAGFTPRRILVTGASSGIGRCVALRLAAQGHTVYAGARQAQDLAALAAVPGVHALALDVCRPDDVAAAAQRIAKAGGLYGLVNNAGIGGLGPLHSWTDAELLQLFDTNVFGPQRTSRTLLPLLLAARGRIVHIGSQGGSISSRWFGPYTMSKHALEAFALCQREELAPHGVAVSIVQPGGVVSEIGAKGAAGTRLRFERAATDTALPFVNQAQAVLAQFAQPAAYRADEPESAHNRKLSPPEAVAAAVEDALFAPQPRLRYLVGTRWEGDRVLHTLVQRLLDANDSPNMHYTRDELVALLDVQLAGRS